MLFFGGWEPGVERNPCHCRPIVSSSVFCVSSVAKSALKTKDQTAQAGAGEQQTEESIHRAAEELLILSKYVRAPASVLVLKASSV